MPAVHLSLCLYVFLASLVTATKTGSEACMCIVFPKDWHWCIHTYRPREALPFLFFLHCLKLPYAQPCDPTYGNLQRHCCSALVLRCLSFPLLCLFLELALPTAIRWEPALPSLNTQDKSSLRCCCRWCSLCLATPKMTHRSFGALSKTHLSPHPPSLFPLHFFPLVIAIAIAIWRLHRCRI